MARAKATTTDAVRSKAAELFERHGYANTSLDDIAEAVGVSKPTLYNYVGSKREVLDQVVSEVIVSLEHGLMAILESKDSAVNGCAQRSCCRRGPRSSNGSTTSCCSPSSPSSRPTCAPA